MKINNVKYFCKQCKYKDFHLKLEQSILLEATFIVEIQKKKKRHQLFFSQNNSSKTKQMEERLNLVSAPDLVQENRKSSATII